MQSARSWMSQVCVPSSQASTGRETAEATNTSGKTAVIFSLPFSLSYHGLLISAFPSSHWVTAGIQSPQITLFPGCFQVLEGHLITENQLSDAFLLSACCFL